MGPGNDVYRLFHSSLTKRCFKRDLIAHRGFTHQRAKGNNNKRSRHDIKSMEHAPDLVIVQILDLRLLRYVSYSELLLDSRSGPLCHMKLDKMLH